MAPPENALSPRERQIIRLRQQGFSYKEIALCLNISIHTVKTHMSRIFAKTKTLNTLAAIYKLRLGCICSTRGENHKNSVL